MGAISKNVLGEGEWCAPTRELKNSKLLKLVHQTRKIITDRATTETEVTTEQDDVVMLVNRKPEAIAEGTQPGFEVDVELDESPARDKLERSAIAPISLMPDGSVASYPMYRDTLRPVRLALAVLLPLAAVAAVLFVLLAR